MQWGGNRTQVSCSFALRFLPTVTLLFFSYSAAAVITKEDGVDDVPYLDKFTVGRKSQVLIQTEG